MSYGQEGHSEEQLLEGSKADKETEMKEYILHHLKDSYDFGLYSYTAENGETKHVSFPLPVILWDNGLKVFMSSKFHHGEEVAEVGGGTHS